MKNIQDFFKKYFIRFVTVVVPTTPNPTAGFLLILPDAEVHRLNMSVDEGMKFIVSLGLVSLSEIQANKLKNNICAEAPKA